MIEEIKEDNNCIVKAFENNPISIIKEEKDNKKIYCFKASDIGKALNIVNIRTSIQNFDGDEVVVRTTYDTINRKQETLFLTSQGVYRLLYSSKKDIAKKFRKWAGAILDDIIFNESQELRKQLEKQNKLIEEKENIIKQLENKPETYGFNARKKGYVYIINDNSKQGHYKIGMSTNTQRRLNNLNTGSSEKSLNLKYEIECYDMELFERTIQNILQPFNIRGRKEWFYFINKTELNCAINVMDKTKEFLDKFDLKSYDEFIENLNENIDNKEFDLQSNQSNQEIKETNTYKLTRQLGPNNTGNYKGVCWVKGKKKWKAELKKDYKISFLGYYDNEEEAAKAYNDYALFINEEENKNYVLNNIQDYIANPRNIPFLNKKRIMEKRTSKYTGVSYNSQRKYYDISIKYNQKTYNLGSSINEEEAAKIYNQQALYFNNEFKTNYELNDIPNYITIAKNIYKEIQDNIKTKKSSEYYGVTYVEKKSKYRSVIVHNKKQIHLGFYDNEIDAAKAYNTKANELNENSKHKYKINTNIS
jgi:prophage antirepressor-like protein